MTTIRRRLRFGAAAWLVFQVASLWALVPRDCCAAHRSRAEEKRTCHDSAAATHCAIRDAGGTACPMHPVGPAEQESSDQRSSDRCSMRGTCDGPMAALLPLLSSHGMLTDSFSMWPDLHARHAAAATDERLISRLASPDSPPPRA